MENLGFMATNHSTEPTQTGVSCGYLAAYITSSLTDIAQLEIQRDANPAELESTHRQTIWETPLNPDTMAHANYVYLANRALNTHHAPTSNAEPTFLNTRECFHSHSYMFRHALTSIFRSNESSHSVGSCYRSW